MKHLQKELKAPLNNVTVVPIQTLSKRLTSHSDDLVGDVQIVGEAAEHMDATDVSLDVR